MSKKEIRQKYKEAEEARIPDGNRLLLICVNRTVADPDLNLIDAVRYSWRISPDNAERADYVLAVAYGLIVGVFEPERPWLRAIKENFRGIPEHHANWERQDGRYGFRALEAPKRIENLYLYKRVPDNLRNHGSAFRYVGM